MSDSNHQHVPSIIIITQNHLLGLVEDVLGLLEVVRLDEKHGELQQRVRHQVVVLLQLLLPETSVRLVPAESESVNSTLMSLVHIHLDTISPSNKMNYRCTLPLDQTATEGGLGGGRRRRVLSFGLHNPDWWCAWTHKQLIKFFQRSNLFEPEAQNNQSLRNYSSVRYDGMFDGR